MASGKTLQSTIEISGVLSPSLQKAIKSAVDRLEEMSAETLDSVGAAEKLTAEIGTQESVLKSLKKGYADYVVSGQKSSNEAKTLANKIKELSGEMNQNKKKLSEAEQAADKFGKSLEESGQKAESSSGGYTVMKDAIGDLVADGIQMAVEAFKELVTEGDNALSMLQAKTGATASEMAGFEDVMYEVYNANYGENLGDVSEKLSTVIQMTDDLDNASLAKVTKSAIALEDVFGFDTVESLRAANSLMDQFGITSDEAFNLIVQGAQNGLNQNDDLLDTINEYSVQFKNAGYTADDMFNMLTNGVEAGTWSVDKLGDAVKEFNIRMSDGSAKDSVEALGFSWESVSESWSKGGDDAKEVFNMLVNELDGLENTTEGYNIGVGLMGTMYEDLGQKAVLALSQTEGAISSTADAMEQMDSAAYDTLESSLSQLGRTIKAEVLKPIADELTPVAKKAVDFANKKVAPAVEWALNNLPTLTVVLSGVAAAVVAFKWASIVDGIKKAGTAFRAFGATLAANPIGLIIIAITALVAAFVYLWNNSEDFRNFWIELWENIKNAVSVAVDWIKDCWEKIKAFFSGDNPIARYFQLGWENIEIVWDVAVSYFKTIWENIKLIFSAVKSVLSGDFSSAWSAIRQIFSNWSSFFSGLFTSVSKIFSNIKDMISIKIKAAMAVVLSAVDKLKNAFNFSWRLPDLKLPHISVSGGKAPYGIAGKGSLPKFSIEWYKDGGIMTSPTVFGINPATGNLMAGGEAGAEAVLPLAVLWEKMEAILRRILNGHSSTGGTSDEGLTATAGKLLTLDNFSLGSLADGTNVVIYYDFSNFTWSPQIQTNGSSNNEDDLMARLRAHEAEFFDWLEEFIKMREVAQYA